LKVSQNILPCQHRSDVAGQADAASIPMPSHILPEASAHVLAVTPTAHWLEVLDFPGAVLADPIKITNGTLTAVDRVSGSSERRVRSRNFSWDNTPLYGCFRRQRITALTEGKASP
jgi:hypothetical protein